jgi:peptidoglycan/LPS O-acetylase OafA/YrhL
VLSGKVRFGLVDSLRALAALSIVGYHIGFFAGAGRTDFLAALSSQLIAGLALFFVISGFVLYRPFVLALSTKDEAPDARAYAWRRFLRIVPAYWAALTVYGLMAAPEVFEQPLIYFGFLQSYSLDTNTGGLPVAFTLCLEVAFYAFLPLYALLVRAVAARFSQWRVEVIGLGVLLVVGVGWRVGGDVGGIYAMEVNSLLSVIEWFAAGMALAVASVYSRERDRPPAAVRVVEVAPLVCWALAAGVIAFEAAVLDRRILVGPAFGGWGRVGIHYADMLFAFFLIAPAVFTGAGTGVGRRVLATRVLTWLGLVSYGIYLWQAIALKLIRDAGLREDITDPTIWWLPLGFGGAIALGAASWYVIERPALSLSRLVPAPHRGPPVEEAEAASVAVAP